MFHCVLSSRDWRVWSTYNFVWSEIIGRVSELSQVTCVSLHLSLESALTDIQLLLLPGDKSNQLQQEHCCFLLVLNISFVTTNIYKILFVDNQTITKGYTQTK